MTTTLVITGLLLMFFAALFVINKTSKVVATPQPVNQEQEKEDELRKNGIKIKVEFDHCDIHDYGYTEERDITDSDVGASRATDEVAALNALTGDGMSNVNEIQVNCVELIYRYKDPETGTVTDYTSSPLNMDKDYLEMTFLAKDVYLYVDPLDHRKYFFDFVEKS